MSTYFFTNRRRAKDAIMLLVDDKAADSMTVFIREGLVYVDFDGLDDKIQSQLDTIMHYAEVADSPIEDLLELDKIQELYKGDGIKKFKV